MKNLEIKKMVMVKSLAYIHITWYYNIYIYAQNRCLAVGWNCLKLGVLSWFLEISNGKMWRNAIWPHVNFFFLCFTTSSVALLPWRRLMEIVLLSLPSNLFYRQSLRSGLLSVLAADASLRRQAPEYFSGFFFEVFLPRALCRRSVCLMQPSLFSAFWSLTC